MVRVLQYISSFSFGGIESLVTNIYDKIDKEKIQFDFLVETELDEKILNGLKQKGANVFFVPKMTEKNGMIRHIKAINKILKENNYKIIHCHAIHTRPWVSIIGKLRGVPCRIFHGHCTSEEVKSKLILRYFLKGVSVLFSNYYLACSIEAARFCFGKKRAKKSYIVKNAIDINKYRYNEEIRGQLRKKYNLGNSFVIGHVGRFVEVKNHDFIVEIFNEVKKKKSDSKLLLVGDGDLFDDTKQKVKKLELENDVVFTGRIDNIEEILQVMDCFILPSFSEGVPITVLEAQASGLSVIASDVVNREVKISNLVDFISLEKSSSYWADKIIEIENYKRKDIYNEICDSEYNIEKLVKEIEEFYFNLL